MDSQLTLWSFIRDAGIVVETVIFLLFLASIASWAIILQRIFLIKQMRLEMKEFERRFWSGSDLATLYHQLSEKKRNFLVYQVFFMPALTNLSGSIKN
ncbi:hypothetical protein [Coxiella-like endosymbiont]|uniref:hypothetical protein n=1 Tax=Coxiella-like endosymbiont TaxID=1592897 RepID=UPI00215A3580|nr:hypothetical protein LG660_03235 [Coxiella-like endosymbiont]